MKKLLCLVVSIALLTNCAIALANFDYRDFCQFPLVKDGEKVIISVATIRSDADGIDSDKMWFWNWLSQATGITFEVEQILGTALSERKALMFAANDLPDLLYGLSLSTSEMVRYGQVEGQLMALNQYINEETMPNASAWFDAYPQALSYSTAPDGNVYTLPWLYDMGTLVGESSRVFLNETWLKEADMQVPETLDDFVAMLYKFKELHPDSTPLGGGMDTFNPMFYILNAYGFLGSAYGYGNSVAVRNGKAVIPAGDPLFKDVLQLLNQFYVDGIISEDFFTLDNTQLNAAMADWKLGVFPFVPFTVKSDKDFWSQWCSVKPLTSAHNDKQQWLEYNTISVGNWAVSANSEHGEILARLADFYFSDIGTIYPWYGPMNGNGDDLGMTEGWIINPETNSRDWPEIVSGKYASTGVYMQQVCCAVGGGGLGNHSHSLGNSIVPAGYDRDNIMRFLYGAPIEEERVYNLEEPDAAFRYSMLQNISPYETAGFPSIVYYDEDTTYAMNDLRTVLETYMQTEIAKFIVGERNLNTFDQFLSDMEKIGLREYEGYYQTAYDAFLAAF